MTSSPSIQTGVQGALQLAAAAVIAKHQLNDQGSGNYQMLFAWEKLRNNPPPGPYDIAGVMYSIEESVLADCVVTGGKNPLLDKVDLLFAQFTQTLEQPFSNAQLISPSVNPITGTRLFDMQQGYQVRENAALEMVWECLAEEHGFPPIEGGHEAIRAWLTNPENAPQIQQLTMLDLSYRGISVLPREIGLFTALEGLNVSNNHLTSLPETIGNLRALQVLVLESNLLCSLPSSFSNLTDLNGLSLAGNRFKTLPESVCHLPKLARLSLAGNLLTTLPPSTIFMENLVSLDLCANQMTTLPEVLYKLTSLIEILASHNKITTIPAVIKNLSELSRLDLSYNQITALPEEIGALKHLFLLNLLYNQLTTLPESLGDLKELRQVMLAANQITTLPHSIFSMKEALFLLDLNPIMFISDIVLAESFAQYATADKILPHYQQALYYTCHSPLAKLFQSIIRNDSPEQIQLAFLKLNQPMQERIKTEFSQIIPDWDPEDDCFDLCASPFLSKSTTSSSSSSSTAPVQADHEMFADMNRFASTVRKATFDKFEEVTSEEIILISENVQKLAGKAEAGWGEMNLFDHMLRFVDALEAATGDVDFGPSHSTPVEGKPRKKRSLKNLFGRK